MKLQTIGACAAVLEAKGLLKNRVTEETAKRAVLQLSCYSREVREGTLFLCKGAAFHEKYLSEAGQNIWRDKNQMIRRTTQVVKGLPC